MCDYQAMYYMLAGNIADALETLEEALLEAEDMYMRGQEIKSALRQYPTEQEACQAPKARVAGDPAENYAFGGG